MIYTVKLTRRAPTAELIGPKNGKIIAKNHIGITTGNQAKGLKKMLFLSCISGSEYLDLFMGRNFYFWTSLKKCFFAETIFG